MCAPPVRRLRPPQFDILPRSRRRHSPGDAHRVVAQLHECRREGQVVPTAARPELKGGGPHQPHPGTRVCRYRCSLPGLTGFTTWRCEGTDADRHRPDDARRLRPPRTMARVSRVRSVLRRPCDAQRLGTGGPLRISPDPFSPGGAPRKPGSTEKVVTPREMQSTCCRPSGSGVQLVCSRTHPAEGRSPAGRGFFHCVSGASPLTFPAPGEVSERFKEHAWKVCVR